MGRRAFLLFAIAVLLGGVAAFAVSRKSNDNTLIPGAKAAETSLASSICQFSALVADGKLADAKNVFWDEVHYPAHIVAADLQTVDRAQATTFYVTKGAVERDLALLAPSLKTDVPPFVAAVQAALVRLAVPGATGTC